MCGEDEEFNQLPAATKSLFTKAYNKLNSSSIKPAKRIRRDNDEMKVAHFDPDVEEHPYDFEDSDEGSGEDEQEIVAIAPTKKGAKSAEPSTKEPASRSRGRDSRGGPTTRGRGTSAGSPQFNSFRGRGSQFVSSPFKRWSPHQKETLYEKYLK